MCSSPTSVWFTFPQVASFLAWSADGGHGLVISVRSDREGYAEAIEVRRHGEDPERPRWLIHRAPDGTIYVTRTGSDGRKTEAASAAEAQIMMELEDIAERHRSPAVMRGAPKSSGVKSRQKLR